LIYTITIKAVGIDYKRDTIKTQNYKSGHKFDKKDPPQKKIRNAPHPREMVLQSWPSSLASWTSSLDTKVALSAIMSSAQGLPLEVEEVPGFITDEVGH
jgi:hypothetical protein